MKLTFKNLNCTLLLIVGLLMLAGSCKKSNDDQQGEAAPGTVRDLDGNVYQTDTIGTQVWMTENLKTTKYRDGSQIPKVTNNNEWGSLTAGAYCNCNNDAANGIKYGRLYNWYAIDDSRDLAPLGWHVATDEDWKTLEAFVAENPGNSVSVAKALAAITDWNLSEGADVIGNDLTKNNSSGFSALPGGNRSNDGFYGFMGYTCGWWSSTESYTYNGWSRVLSYDRSGVERGSFGKACGFYVRCVKD